MIRYGTNPIAWSNDDDRSLGADISLERCLSEASKIGFDGIEQGHKFPSDPATLSAALAPHRLALVSGWWSLALLARSVDDEVAAMQSHLDLLSAMGCEVCIVCETSNAIHGDPSQPLSHSPTLPAQDWAGFGAAVEAVAEHCAARGVTLVYHHHMGTIVETPEEIDALMAATGPTTKLLFDTGHCYLAGGDPAEVLRRHASRVAHLHAKNVRPVVRDMVLRDDLSFLDGVRRGVFTVPGDPEGGVDFDSVLGVAATEHYSGWLVIEAEQDPAQRNPFEYQCLGLSSLRATARAVGLDTGDGSLAR